MEFGDSRNGSNGEMRWSWGSGRRNWKTSRYSDARRGVERSYYHCIGYRLKVEGAGPLPTVDVENFHLYYPEEGQ